MTSFRIERRLKQETHYKKSTKNFPNPINILFFAGFLTTLSISSSVILFDVIPSFVSVISSSSFSPTSIPWINNKSDCEHTGRIWKENKCWDDEHSPMF